MLNMILGNFYGIGFHKHKWVQYDNYERLISLMQLKRTLNGPSGIRIIETSS